MLETKNWDIHLVLPIIIWYKLWEYICNRRIILFQRYFMYDCFDFIHFINGINYDKKLFNYHNWNIFSDISSLYPWNTILMCNKLVIT